MNDMRASRTLIILGADAIAEAESNMVISVSMRILLPSGVCVVGMYESVQSRNLGGPIHSTCGKYIRSRLQGVLMMNRKSDDFIVPGKQSNVCGGKEVTANAW